MALTSSRRIPGSFPVRTHETCVCRELRDHWASQNRRTVEKGRERALPDSRAVRIKTEVAVSPSEGMEWCVHVRRWVGGLARAWAGCAQWQMNKSRESGMSRCWGSRGKPACPASAMMRSCEAGSRWCSSHAEIIGQTTSYLQQQHCSRHSARYNRV